MEGDGAALPLVADVHFQTEDVAELALQGVEVGIGGLGGITGAGPADIIAWTWAAALAPGALLGLPDGQALGDDLAG